MEKREISIEDLQKGVIEYETKKKEEKRIIKKCIVLYCIFILLLFFYMRLYNTKFVAYYGDIAVKYSTAWYIRYPSEFRGMQMEKAVSCSSFGKRYQGRFIDRCPNVKVIEVEEGISTVDVYIQKGSENYPVRWLILPENINLAEEAVRYYFPQKVTFKSGQNEVAEEDNEGK